MDTVVKHLGGQLVFCELWPQEGRLDRHSLDTPLPAQVPDTQEAGSGGAREGGTSEMTDLGTEKKLERDGEKERERGKERERKR